MTYAIPTFGVNHGICNAFRLVSVVSHGAQCMSLITRTVVPKIPTSCGRCTNIVLGVLHLNAYLCVLMSHLSDAQYDVTLWCP